MNEYLLTLAQPILEPVISGDLYPLLTRFMPWVIFYEIPFALLIYLGVIKYRILRSTEVTNAAYHPYVSCIITCYSEGETVSQSIISLTEQLYTGKIQILPVVDGAEQNQDTYQAALVLKTYVKNKPGKTLEVIPKWRRGGRVSAINTGLQYADGEIIFILDGDTSFDNDMIERAVRHFTDPTVAAVSGALRVRNADNSITASLQAIEYFISIETAKTGLSSFNMVNNVSGAFGVFRRSIIDLIKGWDAGTAEDLDTTLRIKQYFKRGNFKIIFDPEALGHTDVPKTLAGFYKQRIRWDGDLPFIYITKHRMAFNANLTGWPNFIMLVINGLYSQLVLPFIIFCYTLWLLISYPLSYVMGLMLIVYLFYLLLLIVMYLGGVLLVSTHKKEELSRLPLLPLFPLFTFSTKINGLIAILYEIFFRSHKDSSMAPWWVTKKSKFD